MNKRKRLISVVALILVIIMTVGTIAGILATTVHAASSSEIQSQINALQQQASDALQKSIDQGGSQEEMERIARDELGLVTPGERVFVDIGR